MRIAIITANIGSLDMVYPPVKQNSEYELYYFTENTLPFPMPNMDNRMKGKYIKTQMHRFLDHDIFIWNDGSIEIINPDYIKICIDALFNHEKTWNHDIVISKHIQRFNVYDELLHVIEEMKRGNRYLLNRYAKQPLYKEFEFYKKEGLPKSVPLYNCFFFARPNNDKVNKMFDLWWDTILRYSNFDQTQFSYALWKSKGSANVIETEDLFIRHRHIGYNL